MSDETQMLPLTEALRQAAQKDNIEEACDLLQTSMGITDGGVAGVCFSDLASYPGDDGVIWAELDILSRHGRLCDYIKTEVNFMPEPRDDPDPNSHPTRAEASSSKEPKVYDRDGMVDENERRAFVEKQEIDEEAFQAFQATRKQMSARAFGEIVGDAMWEDDDKTQFLVYENAWYIEICDDGRHLLVLENLNWITGQDGTLEDLERKLFEFVRDE